MVYSYFRQALVAFVSLLLPQILRIYSPGAAGYFGNGKKEKPRKLGAS